MKDINDFILQVTSIFSQFLKILCMVSLSQYGLKIFSTITFITDSWTLDKIYYLLSTGFKVVRSTVLYSSNPIGSYLPTCSTEDWRLCSILPLCRASTSVLYIQMQCCLMHINKAYEIKIVTANCSLQNTIRFVTRCFSKMRFLDQH